MNQYQTLSSAKLDGLRADIEVRRELQRKMAEHSRPVLAAELGIAINTVASIEKHETPGTRLPESVQAEIRVRRAKWAKASQRMEGYTLDALARKWGVCRGTVSNYSKRFREVGNVDKRRLQTEIYTRHAQAA